MERWLDGAQALMTKDTAALRDAGKLREELDQCTVCTITSPIIVGGLLWLLFEKAI